jgi:Cytochrome P460
MVRRQTHPLILFALPAWLFAACGNDQGDDQEPAAARALYQRIQEQDYRSWRRAPGYETRQVARAPHSDYVDIYVNDVVAAALDAGEPLDAWPVGSLIVKDGFERFNDSSPELVAVMEKLDDGWFWAEYFGGDDAKFSGKPEVCLSCHESGGDYVRAFPLPR